EPADAELLRLPRAACARHAAAEDRKHREPVSVHPARDEGHGRGRRRRDSCDLRGSSGRDRCGRHKQPQLVPAGLAPDAGARVIVSGERTFNAPRDAVWKVLNDPASMAKTMPGVESFDVHDDLRWTANVKIPLGLGGLK